jgi:Skp family chaperone for outer membrane proteins
MIYAGAAIVMAGLLGFNWGKGGGGVHADDARATMQEIAVVDLNKVITAHKGAQALNDELKREAERVQEELKTMQDAGQKLKAELDAAKKGSAEFQRIEQELGKKVEAFKRLQAESQRKLAETNAANLMAIYKEVNEEVTRIAESRGFRLVLNFSSESLDQKDPQKRMMILNRQVLYQNGLDITEDVISAFN